MILKIFKRTQINAIQHQIVKTKIKEIATETAASNAKKLKEYLGSAETLEGNLSHIGFWKIKQKLWPTGSDPPMAKHDKELPQEHLISYILRPTKTGLNTER